MNMLATLFDKSATIKIPNWSYPVSSKGVDKLVFIASIDDKEYESSLIATVRESEIGDNTAQQSIVFSIGGETDYPSMCLAVTRQIQHVTNDSQVGEGDSEIDSIIQLASQFMPRSAINRLADGELVDLSTNIISLRSNVSRRVDITHDEIFNKIFAEIMRAHRLTESISQPALKIVDKLLNHKIEVYDAIKKVEQMYYGETLMYPGDEQINQNI